MKNLFRMLSLLICFEMILAPTMSASGGLFISEAMAEDCPSGFVFDSTLNRCITSQQNAEVMNAVSNCNGDKECYKRNAEQAMKDAEAEGKIKESLANKGGLMGSGMGIMAVAVPLVLVIGMLAKPNACPATSAIIMLGAGVVAFAGEKIANGGHKKRLKEIQEEWDKVLKTSTDSTQSTTTTSTSSTATDGTSKALASEAQSQAFEMLAKSEDSLAKAAGMKKGIYMVAGLAFAGAAVIAGLEQFKPDENLKPCQEPAATPAAAQFDPTKKFDKMYSYNINQAKDLVSFATLQSATNDKYSSPSLEDYEKNKKIFGENNLQGDLISELKEISVKLYYNLIPIADSHALNPSLGGAAIGRTLTPTIVPASTTVTAGGAATVGTSVGTGAPLAGTALTGATTAPAAAAAATPGPVPGILQRPLTRMIAGGIFAVWSGMMAMHAGKQQKIAKNRAEFLRKMKDEFNDATAAIGSCSETDRTNPGKPNCYCYTEAGGRNAERASSDICQKLFNGKSLTSSGDYLASTSSKTCITQTGNEDTSCACRTNNTCAKISVGGVSGLDTGTFSLLNGGVTDLNKIANGTTDAASIGTGTLSNAARLLDANNKNLAKTKKGQEILKNKNKMAQDMANKLIAASAGRPSPLADSSSSLPSSPSQAIAELQKELKENQSNINTASGGQNLAQPNSDGPAEAALDFSLGGDQPSTETQVAEAMKQNLDFNQNDVTNRSDENLFKVLSNRYQRSGMRRLFDAEGKTQADAPNKDDITK